MTDTECSWDNRETVADLPEELLRHSLLLFTDEEETAAVPAEPPSPAAGNQAEQAEAADTQEGAPEGTTLYPASVTPTYHQLVKRELASYLRNRATSADQHRESLRRLASATRQIPPVPHTPPVTAPTMRSAPLVLAERPQPSRKSLGQAVPASSASAAPWTPRQRVMELDREEKTHDAFTAESHHGSGTSLPPSNGLKPRATREAGNGRGPSWPQQLSCLYMDPPATHPPREPSRDRPAALAKQATEPERRHQPHRGTCGQLALEPLTIDYPTKGLSCCAPLGPLAVLQL